MKIDKKIFFEILNFIDLVEYNIKVKDICNKFRISRVTLWRAYKLELHWNGKLGDNATD